jgi:hypothetical protein
MIITPFNPAAQGVLRQVAIYRIDPAQTGARPLAWYIDPRGAVLADTDTDRYVIDSRLASLIDSDSDRYVIDPRLAALADTDTDRYLIDPRLTTLVH